MTGEGCNDNNWDVNQNRFDQLQRQVEIEREAQGEEMGGQGAAYEENEAIGRGRVCRPVK